MILDIQRGLREDGFTVPMTMLCRWLGVPTRTVYYKPVKSKPKAQDRFAEPIKQMIEAEPSFGSDCRHPVVLQQEHRSASLPAGGMAGTQESDWTSSAYRSIVLGGDDAERTLGHRSVPHLGRP
jgi:hypothetical protein